MKKALIAIAAVLIVGVAAVMTCPDKQAHKDAIMAVVNEKINEELKTDDADMQGLSALFGSLGTGIASRIVDNRLVVKESGVYAVEYYIMARYHMYWQVYYHPIARSYESLIAQLFVRLRDLAEAGKFPHVIPEFEPLAEKRKLTLDEFFVLDEYTCSYGFQLLSRCDDPVTADLASRLRDRRLFDYAEGTPENIERITAALQAQGYDPKYYLAHQAVRQRQ